MRAIKFAPREVFEQILEWAVIPTFDLVIEYGERGVILVKRKIPPYQNQWALPGLRMYKGENIDDTLVRIAKQELGLDIDPSERKFLGQYVGKFTTEHGRQDLSTGYCLRVPQTQEVKQNCNHFSSIRRINSREEVPQKAGAMYRFYLGRFFDLKGDSSNA